MAIVGLSAFKYTTDWEFETSEETSVAIAATVAFGKIILKNATNEDRIRLKYRCVSIGLSHGLPINISESHFTDQSGGVGPVYSNKYFDDMCFPCRGWILGAGGTLGVFQSGDDSTNGAVANIIFFGFWPFAGLKCYGAYRGTTPGGGVSGGPAGFSLDDS